MATPAPVPKPLSPPPAQPPAVKASAPAAPAKSSRLAAVKRGQLRSPLRHLFYGPEGVGKTSLVADAKDPILFDIEGGSENVDIARYQFRDEEGGHVPRKYEEVIAGVQDLIDNPGHGYFTFGLDTGDALEALLWRYICERDGKAGIEDYGFGKGYQVALDEWRKLLAMLDQIRARGVQVVILGHSNVRTFKNPEGEDYDRYQLRVHDKTAGLLKEWSDIVGFIRFEGGSAKVKGDAAQKPRARGWTTNRRIVHLSREAAWDAKSRLSMPTELELDAAHPFAPFALAAMGARDADTRTLTEAVLVELDRICGPSPGEGDEFTTAAGTKTSRQAVLDLVKTVDVSTLSRIVAGLQATPAHNAQES